MERRERVNKRKGHRRKKLNRKSRKGVKEEEREKRGA